LLIIYNQYINITFNANNLFLGLLIGVLIYVVEVAVFFMITQNVLIVDFMFYFKGSINYLSFASSVMMLILEELIWRQLLFFNQDHCVLAIIVSSLGFGLSHIIFGKKQVLFKTALGLILTLAYLLSHDILFVMSIHLSYNYFMLRKQGKESDFYGYNRG